MKTHKQKRAKGGSPRVNELSFNAALNRVAKKARKKAEEAAKPSRQKQIARQKRQRAGLEPVKPRTRTVKMPVLSILKDDK